MNIGPKRLVIAAGASIDNLFNAEINEMVTEPSMVYFAFNGDATNGADLVYSVTVGRENVVTNANCNTLARQPIWPDDFLLSEAALPGDKLTATLRNTDAVNAITLDYAVKIEPMPR